MNDTLQPPEERRDAESRAQLCRRIAAEYRDMAGLSLTKVQACRLFDIEPARLDRVVRDLMDRGILQVTLDGRLVRGDVDEPSSGLTAAVDALT